MGRMLSGRSDPEDAQRWSYPAQLAELDTPIDDWLIGAIEGPGGLNDFEYYEMAVANCSDRLATAIWVIKCLGNNMDDETESVLQAVIERRATRQAAAQGGAR
jgi:hypothetical protein